MTGDACAYVSPEHYERRESVPTWNYLAVYAYGRDHGIVGFDMPVTRLEGASKLSQNEQRHERERTAASLLRSADAVARGTGREMQRRLQAEDGVASPE